MKFAPFLLFFFLTHCATAPSLDTKKDLIVAYTALKRAKKASGDKFFPKNYSQAQNFYEKAYLLFQEDRPHEAKKLFQKSIEISEKVELHSLYKKKRNLEM